TQVIVGLYADASGHPGTLLTQGTILSPIAGSWNTTSAPTATVVSGTRYWLAVLSPQGSGTLTIRDLASGGGPTQNSLQTNLTSLPSTWSQGPNWANSPASIFASGPSVTLTPTLSPTPTIIPTLTLT